MKIQSAGKLRSRISIQARDAGQDDTGQPSTTWSEWQAVWARVVSVSGTENFKGQQYSPEVTHVVTVRWLDGINPLHRIVADTGQILDIISVNYGERPMDDIITITCKERISQDGDLDVG